ncbi:hypothetical protein F383_39466 [Gossypium arboreum]|uniref:Uncharacterized protein n=1 Tax=Gossypium arboreum TaxID=29729 RepID=A0A0B0MS68_GOSAR|nr:hypothetical protein F383_39466 [Gossypium arboreum]
MSLGYLGIRTC